MVDGQRHLEDRLAMEVAHGIEILNELFEGPVLVRVGDQNGLAGAAQQVEELLLRAPGRMRSTSV
jgi:hypothetical protein